MAEFGRLKASKVLAYLHSSLNLVKDSLVASPEDAHFRMLQGQAQALQHIVTLIEAEPGKR
jgi:hypothetical protein